MGKRCRKRYLFLVLYFSFSAKCIWVIYMIKRISFPVKILFAMILGVLCGMLLVDYPYFANLYVKPIGTIFLNLIKFIATPLVFLTILSGIASMKNIREVKMLGGRTVVFYLFTTAFAVVIGLLLANVFRPFFNLLRTEGVVWNGSVSVYFKDALVAAIPSNLVSAFATGDMMQVIVAAAFFGIALLTLPGTPGLSGIQTLEKIAIRVMEMIIKLSPIGVFSLIVMMVVETGVQILGNLIVLVLCVYASFLVHILVVYLPLVYSKQKLSPIRFLKGMLPAALLAFSSASSISAISENLKCTEKLGAKRSVCDFVIPLGATLNMDGTGIYQGVCVSFIAACYGINLSLAQCVIVTVSATMMSIGTAGVPGAGMIMLAAALESVGLPVEGVALVAGIDRVLDMGRTAVNVLGDGTCALFLSPKRKNNSKFNFGSRLGRE